MAGNRNLQPLTVSRSSSTKHKAATEKTLSKVRSRKGRHRRSPPTQRRGAGEPSGPATCIENKFSGKMAELSGSIRRPSSREQPCPSAHRTARSRRSPGQGQTGGGEHLHQKLFLLLFNGLLELGKDGSTASLLIGTRGFHSFLWERAFSKEQSGDFRTEEEPLEEPEKERRDHPESERASSSMSPIREMLTRHLSVFPVCKPPQSRYGPGMGRASVSPSVSG